MVHVTLAKQPINQFKPVQQRRDQVLRAYCPNIYTVPEWEPREYPRFEVLCWKYSDIDSEGPDSEDSASRLSWSFA